ncbi:MAG: hypothetical protein A2451_16835, partial [Bdellovibrionales bacterium RIFOXYC2_FULL_39_8]
LRGHGKSEGRRAHVDNFKQYYQGLSEVINFLKVEFRPEKYALMGHSMGALIICGYLADYVRDDFYPSLCFITAPPIVLSGALGSIFNYSPLSLVQWLASISASVELAGLVDLSYLSHDARVREQYIHDDLNALKLHTKLALELVKSAKEVYRKPLRVKCPAVCAIGSADRVVSVNAVRDYFGQVEKGFLLKIFDGAYHELHNEVGKYREPYFAFLKEIFRDVFYPRND